MKYSDADLLFAWADMVLDRAREQLGCAVEVTGVVLRPAADSDDTHADVRWIMEAHGYAGDNDMNVGSLSIASHLTSQLDSREAVIAKLRDHAGLQGRLAEKA